MRVKAVVAFILADLIVLPILDIYRKHYRWRMVWFILGTFYVSMAAAALVVELAFKSLGPIPAERHVTVAETAVSSMRIANMRSSTDDAGLCVREVSV